MVKDGAMSTELRSILKNQSYCTCLMLKVPLTKIERNERTVVFFILLFVVINTMSGLYIVPQMKPHRMIFAITFTICAVLLFTFFALAALVNPGYIRRDPDINFQELLDNTDAYNICPDCKIIRTPRSRHCNI